MKITERIVHSVTIDNAKPHCTISYHVPGCGCRNTAPVETELAKVLHATYRKWAGNLGLGDHLPETWNAVAAAARQAVAMEREGMTPEECVPLKREDVA
jgi:hypothetical protein